MSRVPRLTALTASRLYFTVTVAVSEAKSTTVMLTELTTPATLLAVFLDQQRQVAARSRRRKTDSATG